MCSQAHLLTYANIAHQNTLWVEALLGWDWPCCWVSISTASACSQLVPGHVQPSQNRLSYHSHKPSPGHSHVWKARAKHSSSVGAAHGQELQAWLWTRLTEGALAAAQWLQWWCTWPREHTAVSCSSLELKQALFTLTTALKGKIKADFEVVEFTHQFGFLQVCGIELWAPE